MSQDNFSFAILIERCVMKSGNPAFKIGLGVTPRKKLNDSTAVEDDNLSVVSFDATTNPNGIPSTPKSKRLEFG